MNRLEFFNSISGIEYPNMLAEFFDQFVALKELVQDSGSITVDYSSDNAIGFSIDFKDKSVRDRALSKINIPTIIVYNRLINISTQILSDTGFKIELK